MTIPKDLRETVGSPGVKKEKVGFGTKIKNLLHLGHKGTTETVDTTDSSLGTGTTGLN